MIDENRFLCYAFLLGIFITFVYDLLRILRRVLPHGKFWVSAEDFVFWIFCGVEVFLLMQRESNGTLRWFAVLGAFAGMILYKKTLSGFLVKRVSCLLKKLLAMITKIGAFLFRPAVLLKRKADKLSEKARVRRKNVTFFLKNKLTMLLKMLKIVICKQ